MKQDCDLFRILFLPQGLLQSLLVALLERYDVGAFRMTCKQARAIVEHSLSSVRFTAVTPFLGRHLFQSSFLTSFLNRHTAIVKCEIEISAAATPWWERFCIGVLYEGMPDLQFLYINNHSSSPLIISGSDMEEFQSMKELQVFNTFFLGDLKFPPDLRMLTLSLCGHRSVQNRFKAASVTSLDLSYLTKFFFLNVKNFSQISKIKISGKHQPWRTYISHCSSLEGLDVISEEPTELRHLTLQHCPLFNGVNHVVGQLATQSWPE